MQCRDLREIADSYLGDELTIETNHQVIRHLEGCADCRRELASRRNLRDKLRSAFTHAPDLQMSDEFAGRLRAQLRAQALQRNSFGNRSAWLAIAACLLLALMLGIVVVRQQRAPQSLQAQSSIVDQTNSNEIANNRRVAASLPNGANAALQLATNEILDNAAGDHRNCAVQSRLKEKPVAMALAGRKYDSAYLDLGKAVLIGRKEFAGELTFVKAHGCIYQGRRFGHVILTHRGQLVSLLVTDLDREERPAVSSKESSSMQGVVAAVAACPQTRGYNVACFETARHAVFVVSDLTEDTNLEIARALSTSVRAHVERAESIA